MLLSAKVIKNYINNNSWDYTTNINIRGGEPSSFYFQLIDLDRNGIRYISSYDPSLLSITVNFNSVDDSKKFVLPAVIASVDDKSIWRVNLSGAQTPSSGNLFFTFSENGIAKKFYLMDILKVETMNVGAC